MLSRPLIAAVLALSTLFTMGAEWTTTNFTITVPGGSEQLAERIGQWAEYYRKVKAKEWLGREMPNWPYKCPLEVKVTYGNSGGATSFDSVRGTYLPVAMEVEGKMDRIIASVLPHEITHTVMAHYFGQPVPRWADEGGSVLSEDEQERQQHEGEVRRIVSSRSRVIPLRRLFDLKQYPRDTIVLYAEGYSVTNMLVSRSNRAAFLAFIADGMRRGWDDALQAHYRIRSVEALEAEWLETLKSSPRPGTSPGTLLAGADSRSTGTPTGREVVRRTLPPATPVVGTPRPVVRGVSGGEENRDEWAKPISAPASAPIMPAAGVIVGTPRPKAVVPGNTD
ncbi:MAG: hypothetical protein EBV06_00700 [Planctomycetia bacterium]|nr:hypothetical protein [Planctomycetia bacterium]